MNNIISDIVNAYTITSEPDMHHSYNGPHYLTSNWIRFNNEAVTTMFDLDDENEEIEEDAEHIICVCVNNEQFDEPVFEGTLAECDEFVEKLYDAMYAKFKEYEREKCEEEKRKYLADIDEAVEYLTVKSPCTAENLISDGWFESIRQIAVHVAHACERFKVSVKDCFDQELYLGV